MKKFITISSAVAVMAGVAALMTMSACGDDETEFDRQDMLRALGDGVITETNIDLHRSSEGLESSAIAFCETPEMEALEQLQQSWREVKEPLKRAESFSFGPYRYFGIEIAMDVDKWPGRSANIEDILEGDEEIDQSFVQGLDYTNRTKGFPAIEYLIFDAPDSLTVVEAYTQHEETGDRRCEYLLALTEHAHGVVDEYYKEWSRDYEGYTAEFVRAGRNSGAFGSEQDAVTAVIETILYALDEISIMKLGTPLGLTQAEANPEDVEAPYSETSLEHAIWTLDGVEALYMGPEEGYGLTDYIQFREQSGAVDSTVRERLDAARDALEAIPAPLHEAVIDNADEVEAAIDAVDALNQAFSGEVSTLLGINPTTVEGDND